MSPSSLLRFVSLATVVATAVPLSAGAAGNTPAIQECVRDIAKMERIAARQHKGLERRIVIANLGKAKIACMDGKIEQAYTDAAKAQGAPQQAAIRD